ncbi:MAG: COX15/CtaA family protein [Sideroxydans sp.]|jgi:cytochrome c oxidase assembly protein subunit 15
MYFKLILTSCALAFVAVVLSAYVRLSDAGLGCADWPACYENNALKEKQTPQADVTRGYTSWQRKLHSQVVMLLGFLSIAISGIAWLKRRDLQQSPLLPTLLTCLMVFLALFGIWAFSHLPRAIIVPVHLAGGVSMLILLTWMLLRQIPQKEGVEPSTARQWHLFSWLGLILVVIQIALGSWVSSNFAAIACTDFPLCRGYLLPPMDFSYPLDGASLPLTTERLTAIHWMHRFGAILTMGYLIWLSWHLIKLDRLKKLGASILLLIALQSGLGISNVLLGLPLAGAVLHNAVAMMLVITLVLLNFRLREQRT